MTETPRLYDELATWWPLMSSPEDYEEEAAFYRRALLEACSLEEPRTLLELGSGGGNNALFLKRRFELALVDLAPGMLEVSRSLNPECEHFEGDMRTVRLGRRFDLVFAHDAVCYMTTAADLRLAIETAWEHLRPGGAALLCPDYVKETFAAGADHGGHDGPDGRGLRYLEWIWDPDPDDTTYVVDYAYLLREPDGSVHAEHDRHVEGLFARDAWLRILGEVGFEASSRALEHSEVEPGRHLVFAAAKPR